MVSFSVAKNSWRGFSLSFNVRLCISRNRGFSARINRIRIPGSSNPTEVEHSTKVRSNGSLSDSEWVTTVAKFFSTPVGNSGESPSCDEDGQASGTVRLTRLSLGVRLPCGSNYFSIFLSIFIIIWFRFIIRGILPLGRPASPRLRARPARTNDSKPLSSVSSIRSREIAKVVVF